MHNRKGHGKDGCVTGNANEVIPLQNAYRNERKNITDQRIGNANGIVVRILVNAVPELCPPRLLMWAMSSFDCAERDCAPSSFIFSDFFGCLGGGPKNSEKKQIKTESITV